MSPGGTSDESVGQAPNTPFSTRLRHLDIQSSPLKGWRVGLIDNSSDAEADMADDDSFGEPEGVEDLEDDMLDLDSANQQDQGVTFIDNDDEEEEGEEEEEPQRKVRPAFYDRSVVQAEKSALRSTYDENNTFFLVDEPVAPMRIPKDVGNTIGACGRKNKSSLVSYAKRVTADLDSDDELMLVMREKGYNDQQIADRLRKEGRCKYDRKSISTRINRIKWAQAARVDELLIEGYKEWQLEDDETLHQAYEFADQEIEAEIERLRAWRFRKVSDWMRKLNPDAIFSAKACKDRFIALKNGTATIPIELDDNPMQRRMELQEYQEKRESKRQAEIKKKELEAEAKQKAHEEARIRNAEKAEQAAHARAEREAQRAERATQRAAQQQLKLQQAEENKTRKQQEHAKRKQDRQQAKMRSIPDIRNPNSVHKGAGVVSLKDVTINTPDPRRELSFNDLKALCAKRNLSASGRTKAELVETLRSADNAYSAEQLKSMCRAKGLNIAGNKIQLRHQLAQQEVVAIAEEKEADEEAAAASAGVDENEADDEEGEE